MGNKQLDELIEVGAASKLPQIQKHFRKNRRIASIKDNEGNTKSTRNGIAEVFATFYQSLYSAPHEAFGETLREQKNITGQDLRSDVEQCIKKLKRRKACAEDGLVAEMLKDGGRDMIDAISDVFADLLNGETRAPESWNISKIVVLFKKGDATLPKNYRPIAIIPVLSKLYSSVLLRRMEHVLDNVKTPEEMGFRKGYGCCDLVHCLRMVSEKGNVRGKRKGRIYRLRESI